MKATYKQMTAALSYDLLKRECRLSERQMVYLRWTQIQDGKLIMRQREVELSENLVRALGMLPCSGRYIFGNAPLLPPEKHKMRDKIAKMLEALKEE